MTSIVTTITDWQKIRSGIQGAVGFVPTMGNLHEGHLSLLTRAKNENSVVIASIFVNPAQFNDALDYKHYPRTIEDDIEKCRELSVDYVFMPSKDEIYPDHYEVQVKETQVSQLLEGGYRPGHFDGMLTVVLKLFNIINAQRAYFGEKDYQQLMLIKKMVASLFLSVDIVACETIRAIDGLALSSRNSRLSDAERIKAGVFARLLASPASCEEVIQLLQQENIRVDYVEEKWGRRLGAVWVGNVRLIDNVVR